MTLRSQFLLATTLTALIAAPAFAQEGMIETVTVTAQKRSEDLQKVAISMEVLQADALQAFNKNSIQSLTSLVPNFYFQPSPGNDALYIRGFGSAGSNFGFEQSVSLYQDGIFAGRARQFMAPFFDVDHIEVLRGPQGALLGKNTAAGAVSIITAGPTETFEGKVTAHYNIDREGFDTYGYVAGPITDDLGARLAVKYTNFDGYVTNTATGKKEPRLDNQLARLTLKYLPQEGIDVTAKIEYSNFNTAGDPAGSIAAVPFGTKPPAPTLTKADSNIFGFDLRDGQSSWNASVTANFAVGDHTLTTVTGLSTFHSYRAVDASHEANSRFHNQYFEKFTQLSQEVRLLSPTGQRFEYIVGGYWDKSDYNVVAPTYYNIVPLAAAGQLSIDFKQNSETWSVFAAGTLHITEYLRLRGSARYTYGAKDATFVETQVSGNTAAAIGGPRAFAKAISEDSFDPSITIEGDVSDDVMVYASYGRGSKGGGYVSAVRTTLLSGFSFRPERSTNYEAGIKSTWLDGRLIANGTIFYTEVKDLQVSAYNAVLANTITTNAAQAHTQGFEGSLVWLPIDELRLSSSFAFTESRYDNYPGAGCTIISPPGCAVATNNLKGFPLQFIPKWSGNVRAEWTKDVGDDLKLVSTLMATFKTKYYVSTDYSPDYGIQDAWAKLDARIQLGASDDKWNVALIVTNLTDETTVPFSYAFPAIFSAGGNRLVRYVDEPRTVAIEGTLRF